MRPRVKMVRNNGRYSLFSETKLQVLVTMQPFELNLYPQPVDFLHLEGEVQGGSRSLVSFTTKLQMVEALRDPVVQRKYPNLAISKNSIMEKWALNWGSLTGKRTERIWWSFDIWWICFRLDVAKAWLCVCTQLCIFCNSSRFRHIYCIKMKREKSMRRKYARRQKYASNQGEYYGK